MAVTGCTGDVGRPFLAALEDTDAVEHVAGFAADEFDPQAYGFRKLAYTRGDVLDRGAVEELVRDADVVVHLAFLTAGRRAITNRVNVKGSVNVFEAVASAGNPRLVHMSSAAAYGFREDNRTPLTEDAPLRGTPGYVYSNEKAAVERHLERVMRGRSTEIYVFRPVIIGGRSSLALVARNPFARARAALPPRLVQALTRLPLPRPVLPEAGVPLQLAHADDVADALARAVTGTGEPGPYNLAGPGTVSPRDVTAALGWRAVRVPRALFRVAAKMVAMFHSPSDLQLMVSILRVPMLLNTWRAECRLGWRPMYDSRTTLLETVAGARATS